MKKDPTPWILVLFLSIAFGALSVVTLQMYNQYQNTNSTTVSNKALLSYERQIRILNINSENQDVLLQALVTDRPLLGYEQIIISIDSEFEIEKQSALVNSESVITSFSNVETLLPSDLEKNMEGTIRLRLREDGSLRPVSFTIYDKIQN